jgi:hypothetical protein
MKEKLRHFPLIEQTSTRAESHREFKAGMPKPGLCLVRVRPAATPVGDAAALHFAPIRPNSGWVPLTKSGRRFETKFLAPQIGLEIITQRLTA